MTAPTPVSSVAAVIFDWGGTLTPWHDVDLPEQWRVFAREVHGIPVDSPEVSEVDLERAHELAETILAAESDAWKRGREDHSSASIEQILDAAGVDAEDDRHHLALAAYQGFWEPHTHTDPQVRPLWEGLRERGIRVGVLSNTIWSREYHREIFARDGVLDLIDGDVYSSEIHCVKPHPDAFRLACEAVGVAPREAVYVGDRIFEDVHGPQQIGMRAIWVPHSDIPAAQRVEVTAEPDARAQELLDILDIVDRWLDEGRADADG
ncbi:putative hydrolase of the HAD superfamily [Knoellia remsis]|uniref:Putative hydrolase of the HAD superfamily n=1 Tax=Knoellia remsis TaxID=407159 RepID=A0A2T0UZS9_9MICO|nr:HAD family hydrolase [Knoellia remsis]PRY63367.1 putative hydrolase of the HAD superfamily [Knoellia remsis]